jgi:two-component system chemotaxis response regulator CheB
LLAEIVGQHTSLSVSYGQQGDTIKLGHVYFAPPDLHLVVVAPGFLMHRAGPKVHFTRPAAAVLFQSAAEVYGPRVIGVVLTGGDYDGTEGLRATKAAAGMSVVQDPNEARDPSMPRSALTGGHPDHQVSLDEMAALLTRLTGR